MLGGIVRAVPVLSAKVVATGRPGGGFADSESAVDARTIGALLVAIVGARGLVAGKAWGKWVALTMASPSAVILIAAGMSPNAGGPPAVPPRISRRQP